MQNRIDRRSFVRLAGLSLAAGTAGAAGTGKPNIIYILADDLGYGDLSCYGQQKFTTPHIDSLAAEGMRFTDHYAGSTVCAPSRCCLMTGRHTGHAFIRGNKEIRPVGQHPIPANSVTVAELLKKAGYATGGFGKWGLGPPKSAGDPVRQGFDEFFGYYCQRHAHNYYVTYLWHNAEKVPLDGKTFSHDLIMEKGMTFIRKNKDRPFFCYLPVTIPHAAMHCPEESVAPFRKKFPQFEDRIGKYAGPKVKNPIAAFAGMVTRLDRQVGQIVELLKELKIDDRTLVMFTSDNGCHREGGHDPGFFNSNGPLRGIKRDLFEGGIRVPLVARWPGKIPAGKTSDHISAFWDMMPTFCELAGVDCPADTDGISMVPALRGEDDQKKHGYLYWEFKPQGGKVAVRKGRWKAVRLKVLKNPDGPLMLFDLENDVAEKNNVAAQHPKIVADMEEIIKKAHTPSAFWEMPLG